jgi:hypothetical protein
MFGIIIADLLTPTAAKTATAASAREAAATTRAAEATAAACAAKRPLLSERPALRAALRELSSLAPTAHITKGAGWALAGETLAATGRPLGRPARTTDASSHPAGPTGACSGHPASSAGPACAPDTPYAASSTGPARAADTSNTPRPAPSNLLR